MDGSRNIRTTIGADFSREEDAELLGLIGREEMGSGYWGALAMRMTTGRTGTELRQRVMAAVAGQAIREGDVDGA